MNISKTWLMLVNSVSGENKTARMRIWRRLKASGAGALRDGVYLLPNSDDARAVFAEQSAEVIAAGGTAHLLCVDAIDESQQREFVALFDRGAEYAELFGRLDSLKAEIVRLEEAGARRQLSAMRRDVAALAAIDFFPGPPRQHVDALLADLEAAFKACFSPDEPHAARGLIPKRDKSRFRGRTWATRQHLWVDRVASAWLIRRFIDPKAKFLWLKRPKDCPRTALGFDFDGAEFTHVDARVTFEVLIASFGLEQDRALVRLGAMVHHLDVGGVAVPEAAGFAAIMSGARARQPNDDKLLQSMSVVLDNMYVAYSEQAEQ